MAGRGAVLATLAVVAAGGLLVGCGTPGAAPVGTARISVTPATSDPQVPCAMGEGDPGPRTDCLNIDPGVNIKANQFPRSFQPLPTSAAQNANSIAAEVPAILQAVRAHPPVTETSVRAALSGLPEPPDQIEVSKDAAGADGGVGYGIEVGSACVHGFVAADDQQVLVDGMSEDGGCLPMVGH